MSLRRLVLSTLLGAFDGPVRPDWVCDLTTSGMAGFVLFSSNIVDPGQLTELTASIHADRTDALIAIDEEGGDVTRLYHRDGSPYPGNAALGAVDDPALTMAIYSSIGADLAAVGIDLDLAPDVDVNTSSENPVIGTRSFGADPSLVARHAAAAVVGLQSVGVAACAKHFPGHGATTVDSHRELPTVSASLGLLTARDLPPFAAAASAGAMAIMTAHVRIPALTDDAPATFSPAAIALLRNRIGFEGVVVTDALEMRGAVSYAGGVTRDGSAIANGAVLALAAGSDLLCIGAKATPELVERIVAEVIAAVDDGRLPLSRIEEAAARVARLAAWVATNRTSMPPGEPELGLVAARRAIRVEGHIPDLSKALVVQVEATSTIAEGRVPWGLLPHLKPGTATLFVDANSIAAIPTDRRIVMTGRNLRRYATTIEALAGTSDVVVVEMGWPSAWRPKRVRAYVMTYGASAANSRATAETLGLIDDRGTQVTLNP